MLSPEFIINSILMDAGKEPSEHPYIGFVRYKQLLGPNFADRCKFDADARMLGDERGDCAVSLWAPTKYLINKRTGVLYLSSEKYAHSSRYIRHLESKLLDPGNSELLQILDGYALAFYRLGNMILLPDSAMNTERTQHFGNDDRIDITLSRCFPGGSLERFFRSVQLEDWVNEQHLTSRFEGGKIQPRNLRGFGTCDLNKLYDEMTEQELISFLDDASRFITDRTMAA
jgi:hypothetical protein